MKVKLFSTDEYIKKNEVINKINSRPYNDEDGFGFVVQDNALDGCKVQYIEKNTLERQIETPLGDVSIIQEVTYYKFQFVLRYDSLNSLVFINPPRNMKYASDIVRSIMPENVHVTSLNVDLKEKIEELKHKFQAKLKCATLSNIFYDNNTQAKTKLSSTGDLYDFYSENFKRTIAKVDVIVFDINGRVFELSDSGRINTQGDSLADVFNFI
nr:MAG TPA: hypothetical protein [Caudoviricetes sp.]